MIEATIRSITLVEAKYSRGDVSYEILAFANVDIGELDLTFAGVALTWSKGRGYCAMAPNSRLDGANGQAVRWRQSGALAHAVREALLSTYRTLGGTLPDDPDNSGLHRAVGAA